MLLRLYAVMWLCGCAAALLRCGKMLSIQARLPDHAARARCMRLLAATPPYSAAIVLRFSVDTSLLDSAMTRRRSCSLSVLRDSLAMSALVTARPQRLGSHNLRATLQEKWTTSVIVVLKKLIVFIDLPLLPKAHPLESLSSVHVL